MDIPRQPEGLIDVEGDDLDTVAKKLGVEPPLEAEGIVLKQENLSYLNDERDSKGNTILMRFARLGKEDIVGFLVKCEGISVNERNREYDTAADIALSEHHFGCLLKLLQGEAELPYVRDTSELQHTDLVEFIEQRQKLHRDIKLGDMKSVETYTKRHKSSKFLCVIFQDYGFINQSALFWAAKCNQLEVYAYLLNNGAKFNDLNEEKRCRFNDTQRKELNEHLEGYFVKIDNSHVLKLMQSSHSPKAFSDLRKDKIKGVYEYLNNLELVSLIMKVLEYEDVDVVFDFEKEHTNDVFCLNNSQIYGFTVPSKQRIFIAAKKCESTETVSMDVAGTLAHELCHMAMEVLYRNEAKPYEAGEKDTDVFEKYEGIVTTIKTHCQDKKEEVDQVIKMVYNYNRYDWHAELIVRVPHILAMYGDKDGKALLQEQAKCLFEFFLAHVIPKCKQYVDSSFFKKALCMIEPLHKHHGCIKDEEKRISPLKEPTKSFKDHLIPNGNISVIVSSNTGLCSLHVYHELKKSHSCHMDKQCLFFNLDCFKSNWKKILGAFKSKVCKYMVLVTNEKMLKFEDVSKDFDDVKGCGEGKNENNCDRLKNVILIVGGDCEGLHDCGKKKALNYQWCDLSDQYKNYLIRQNYGLLVNFKGKETRLMRWIDEKKLAEIIQPEDMQRLTKNELIQLGDGRQLTSKGHNREYYMNRTFVKHTVQKSIFNRPLDATALFVTGLKKEDLEHIDIDRRRIQWIEDSTKGIDTSKHIFIKVTEKNGEDFFDKLSSSRLPVNSVVWLHFSKDEVHLMMFKGSTKAIEQYIKEDLFTERQLIETSMERVVLISDDPGMGKSTVLTELIRIMRDGYPDWWVGRIDLNDYADDKENPLSLENIVEDGEPDDVLNIFIRMLGMKTSLEVYLFKQFVRPKGLKREYKIFIDAFDEISPSYKAKVLTLFRCLIEKTTLQLWITTRKHEKLCLETEFGTFSYSLKEFTVDVQVTCLDNFWKHKIKSLGFQNSEVECLSAIEMIGKKIGEILEEKGDLDWDVFQSLKGLKDELENSDSKTTCYDKIDALRICIEGLDFTPMATFLVNKASVVENENRFLGIPLHLFMLGNVAYNNNLRLGAYSNVHELFSEFVEGKIRIYWKEKTNSQYTGITRKRLDRERIEIIRFHKRVAKCVIDPDSYPWDTIADSDDLGLDVTVGILTRSGDQFQFVHRTFAEFFFSEWLLEMMKLGKLGEDMLREVIREYKYSVVRRFLDDALQNGNIRDPFSKAAIQMWDLAMVFEICSERAKKKDFTGKSVLKAILSELIKKRDPSLTDVFLNNVSKYLYKDHYLNINVFKLLNFCFTDAFLFRIFFEQVEPKLEYLLPLIGYSSANDVSEVLEAFERVYRTREHRSRREKTSGAHSQGRERNGDEPESDGFACREEDRTTLIDARSRDGLNVLHYAVTNVDETVLVKVLGIVRKFRGEAGLMKLVQERDGLGRTLLHMCAEYGGENIVNVISDIRSVVDSESFVGMFRGDDVGDNVLFFVAYYCTCEVFVSLLEYLREILEENLLRDLLFDVDMEGRNVLHCAAMNREIGTLDSALRNVRIELKDEKKFAEFVMRSDGHGRTIFHWRARWGVCHLRDLTLLESFIGRDGLLELLAKVSYKKETWLHVLFEDSESDEVVLDGLNLISDLFDVHSLERFILASDALGNTVLHKGARNIYMHDKLKHSLSKLEGCLNDSSFQMLMNIRNNEGQTVRIEEHGDSIELKLHKQETDEEEERDQLLCGGRVEKDRDGGRDGGGDGIE